MVSHSTVDYKEESNDISSPFSRYINNLESLQRIKTNPVGIKKVDDFITLDSLSVCELDEMPTMESFLLATSFSFRNEVGKHFCWDLSFLCSKHLCEVYTWSRDTLSDGFKLKRELDDVESRSSKKFRCHSTSSRYSSSHGTVDEWVRSTSDMMSKGSKGSSGQLTTGAGNRSADLIVSSFKKRLPLVIFECKSTGDVNDNKKGMAQLVSHGLALRDKKQVAHNIKLVLITPHFFFLASLPAYKHGNIDEEYCELEFKTYELFVWNKFKREETVLDRNAYIAFLRNLHQHFESVKSVE